MKKRIRKNESSNEKEKSWKKWNNKFVIKGWINIR